MNGVGATKKPFLSSAKGVLVLSRIPFLSPGVASLVTGFSIAIAEGHDPSWGLIWLSVGGIILIMLATYYFNEYFDYEGDLINSTFTVFSGGSRALPDRMVGRPVARTAGLASVFLLVVMAVAYLLFYFSDYPLLLPLALFGAFCGIFYSHPPFQWAYRGIGELVIGGCYGILAVVSGFYLASGVLDARMIVVALPASVTIWGVIVANEFPDIEADRAVRKRTMVVRLGLERAGKVFAAAIALSYPLMLITVLVGMSYWVAVVGLPVLALSAMASALALKRAYETPAGQTKIAGCVLLANLLSSLLFIPVAVMW
jgi:1,4-dihydroxy-2-naphthoate octaprenyltransferase